MYRLCIYISEADLGGGGPGGPDPPLSFQTCMKPQDLCCA